MRWAGADGGQEEGEGWRNEVGEGDGQMGGSDF